MAMNDIVRAFRDTGILDFATLARHCERRAPFKLGEWRQNHGKAQPWQCMLSRVPMTPFAVLALALRILSDSGTQVGNPVQVVVPAEFAVIQTRIAPLRAFRRRIDGVLDPVIYVLRTTQTFERAAAGHAPSAVLVAGCIFHEWLHGNDDAEDEASVLTKEAGFLQGYIARTLVRLSTDDRRFLERHIDQLRARAKRIVPTLQYARGPSAHDVVQ